MSWNIKIEQRVQMFQEEGKSQHNSLPKDTIKRIIERFQRTGPVEDQKIQKYS